jgi:endoglucanase
MWRSVLICALASVTHANVISPAEMQKMMGLGINLGNRIDLWQQDPRKVKEHYFEQFKQAGFTNVRIPVCWHMHTQEQAPYKVDDDFMGMVEQFVDWSLSRGMVTILNTHHEQWLDNASAFDAGLPRFEALWSQIAERFASRNQTLLFEIFNEPHVMTSDQLNKMNAAILPVIRKTNPNRIVFIAGLQFSNPSWIVKNPNTLVIPSDPQIMLEFHNYDPWSYAGAKPSKTSWGSDADRATLASWMDDIDAWSKSKKIPIYYGEFGVTNAQTSQTGRDEWFKAHFSEITKRGWAASVWNDGQGHLIYNYDNYSFVDDILVDLGRSIPPPSPAPPPDRCCHGAGCAATAFCPAKAFCTSSESNCESKCNGVWCPGDAPAPSPPTDRCCHGPKGCAKEAYCPAKAFCTSSQSNCETNCKGTWCPGNTTAGVLV